MHLACPKLVGTLSRAASQPLLMLGRGRKRGLRGRFSSMHDLGLIFCTCMCNFSCSILDYRLQSRPSLTHCSKNSNFLQKLFLLIFWVKINFIRWLTFFGDKGGLNLTWILKNWFFWIFFFLDSKYFKHLPKNQDFDSKIDLEKDNFEPIFRPKKRWISLICPN